MLMEEVFDRLREFQEILTKRVEIEKEVEDIPKALVAQEELLSRLRKTYIEKHEAFVAAEALVKDLRGQLTEAEAAREAAEKQMDSISTQREYEAPQQGDPGRHRPGTPAPEGPPGRRSATWQRSKRPCAGTSP